VVIPDFRPARGFPADERCFIVAIGRSAAVAVGMTPADLMRVLEPELVDVAVPVRF